ncbi:hypothetical protein BU630_11960 [Staphylococcus capitis]|nr:hypothetical protein [Staphylococcus capitis]PTG28974.1 hypothetical protein BU630_11960 [Staphylococcus capitis]
MTFAGASSVDPSGYLTLTGISSVVPGLMFSDGVTTTLPSSPTVASQPSGVLPSGISNSVPSGN